MRVNFAGFGKKLSILFGLLSIAFSGLAQQRSFELAWEKGIIILTTGDTVAGPVSLRQPEDIIRVTGADGTVRAFAAVNVKFFDVNREKEGRSSRQNTGPLQFRRVYQSFMWNHDKDYSNFKSPAFFVVLQSGIYTLLMRENLELHADYTMSPYYPGGGRPMREVIVANFYLLKPDKQIISLRNPKKVLPEAFGKNEKKIAEFAKENKLDYNEPIQLSRIVEYANSLL